MSEVKQKFDDVSKKYDLQRKALIPCFNDFYNIAASLASVAADSPNILDLGAGTGILTSYVLKHKPSSKVTLVDISEKMLEIARQRFSGNDNVEYIVGDYSNYSSPEKFDIIVSALSIHHLDDAIKKSIYDKCYSLLNPNGIFINADQVYGETPFIENLNKKNWKESIENSNLEIGEIQSAYERIKLDKEASLEQQLDWLKEAGFTDVCCAYKYFHFAVLFGRKI